MAETSEQNTGNSGKQIDAASAKKAMKAAVLQVKRLGAGAAGILANLKKDKSPESMLETMEESIGANRSRRESASSRVEALYQEIADKKKDFASAPAARKRVLEMELRTRLSEYKAAERELAVLLENERILCAVKGRIHEIAAYGIRGVSESMVDDVTGEIDELAAEADGVVDATQDMETSGKRRSRDDAESLWEELEAFDGEHAPGHVDADDDVGLADENEDQAGERRMTDDDANRDRSHPESG